mmetsp:Transcript_28318/g.64795  ORF Transcript_28318/g.64795 Transcript_28318/m.64795 type:complete len:93 (+) Transcript_28318:202-480(+)
MEKGGSQPECYPGISAGRRGGGRAGGHNDVDICEWVRRAQVITFLLLVPVTVIIQCSHGIAYSTFFYHVIAIFLTKASKFKKIRETTKVKIL